MGARDITLIRTYEETFMRKTKFENYIAALATKSYPYISRALISNTETYNSALEFIKNPPSDCAIKQICPPHRLKTKRATTNHSIMKADYLVGTQAGQKFLQKFL